MFRILSKVKPSQAKPSKKQKERERQRKKKLPVIKMVTRSKSQSKVKVTGQSSKFKGPKTENRNPKRLRQYKKGVGKKQRYFFFFQQCFSRR